MNSPPPSSPDPWLVGFQLGDWRVDVSANRLQRGAEQRPLRHKAMALLLLLARHAGRTVTRDEIVDAIWDGNRFVAPKAINTAVWTIRQALGDDPEAPRYLETIAKKGYRLIAEVRPLAAVAALPLPRRRRCPWAVGAGLLVALLLAGLGLRLRPQPAVLPAAPTPLTQESGVEYLGALAPDGRRLAFAWWRGRGDGELHLRRLDAPTQASRHLAAGQGDVNSLAWAPDGASLAFSTLGADGRCRLWLQALPPGDGDLPAPRALALCAALHTPLLAWSPDGRQLVFSAEREGAGGLFAVAPDGSGLQRLTRSPPAAMPDHQPAWSPDGRALAFVRQDPADGTRDLYEWRPGAAQPQRLTQLRLRFVHGLTPAADGRDLIFSTTQQDTRVLMRWQRRDGATLPLGLEGSAPQRAADGSLVYALLRTHVGIAHLRFGAAPQRVLHGIASDRVPRPDPAGGRLAFVSRRSGAPELWLAAPDGSAARALTALAGVVGAPAWSPRGAQLAFIGSCGPQGRVGLCSVAAAGGKPQVLDAEASDYGAPSWHPQRDEIWVASDRGGAWRLWRFAASGGAGRIEPTEQAPGRALQWQADGSGFVYQVHGTQQLRWRAATGAERALAVADAGEELVDWQLADGALTTLTRGERERWRRIDLASGRRQLLAELPLGSLPERARFALDGREAVWVEVANTQVGDLMRASQPAR